MKTFRPGRPSPALVIALIALFVALGGTAYASFSIPKNSIGSKQLKSNAVTTKKIKKGAVTAAKINPKGLTVPNATSAQAIAYAHVEENGTLDTTNSKNVSASSLTAEKGLYCLKATVPVNTVSATVDSSTEEVGFASAILSGEDPANLIGELCPAGMNVLVVTYDASSSETDEAFWLSFN